MKGATMPGCSAAKFLIIADQSPMHSARLIDRVPLLAFSSKKDTISAD
jgi:hypothetical protein